nr:hypothetical protein [Endozoicomonas sp.]
MDQLNSDWKSFATHLAAGGVGAFIIGSGIKLSEDPSLNPVRFAGYSLVAVGAVGVISDIVKFENKGRVISLRDCIVLMAHAVVCAIGFGILAIDKCAGCDGYGDGYARGGRVRPIAREIEVDKGSTSVINYVPSFPQCPAPPLP